MSSIRSNLIFALSCLVAFAFGCAKSNGTIDAKSSAAIYGGHDVTLSSQLWRSSVAIKSDTTICSGVLLSRDVVLTAGHCMWAFKRSKGLTILFFEGADSVSDVRLDKRDYRLVTHPSFDEDGSASEESSHDLGLVIVGWEMVPKTHGAPKLFAGSLKAGDSLLTVGNGLTESGTSNQTGEGMLRFVQSKLKSLLTKDNGKTIQAFAVTTRGSGTCGGDSGGAVYVRTPENNFELMGIHVSADDTLSSEIGCGKKTGITVLTPTMRRWARSYL